MKVTDLQVWWAFIVMLILVYAVPYAILKPMSIATFGGGFAFFTLLTVAMIIYVAIFMAIRWKEVLK